MTKEIVFTTETRLSTLTIYLKTSNKSVETSIATVSIEGCVDKVIDLDLTYSQINQIYTSIQTLTIYDDYTKSKNRFNITLTDDNYNCQYIGEAFDFMYEKILKVFDSKIIEMKELINLIKSKI